MSIAYARLRYAAQLKNSGTILRATLASDGAGGTRPGTPERIEPIFCSLRAASGRQLAADEQIQQRGAYRLKLAWNTDLRPTDQFELGGQVYTVVWTPPVLADSYLKIVGIDLATPADAT